ncbi:MAG: polysaccharide biosynthesis/export family protein [Elusimicrobia bacterium]|nr:polysaccharide biosynthesis/export family protein [Elusimicrobiota bacterium]
MTLLQRARRIRLLMMDVDGVLTDGLLYHFVDDDGRLVEMKGFNSQDGVALVWLAESGVLTGVITGRASEGVEGRARMLKMTHVVQGTTDKLPAFKEILAKAGLRPEQAAFIGDDFTDLPAMRHAGLAAAVANARPELLPFAHLVTQNQGGKGAVREVVELLMRSQGTWQAVLKRFSAVVLLGAVLPLAGCVGFKIPKEAAEAIPSAQAEGEAKAPEARKAKGEQAEEAAIQRALQLVQKQQTSYKISPADLLEITVYQEKDLERKVRVSPEGVISFPLIGQVQVAGLSVPEAEDAVINKLKRFYVSPQVTIFIQEYGNKQVYVLGEVKNPGSYALPTEAPLTVLEALTLAGGFSQYAAVDRTRVIRNVNGKSESYTIEITAITKRGDKSKDLRLAPNDVIYVPESFF